MSWALRGAAACLPKQERHGMQPRQLRRFPDRCCPACQRAGGVSALSAYPWPIRHSSIRGKRHCGNEERFYRSRTNAFVALTGVSPVGVKVPSAVSLSRLACLSRCLPVAVSLILIVAVPAVEKLC